MKSSIVKLIVGLVLCLLLSIGYSTYLKNETFFPNSAVNTIFTIIGVFFSVGMSLIIASPQVHIKNETVKKKTADMLKTVKGIYIILFLLVSALYIFMPNNNAEIIIKGITINAQDIFVTICLYTLIKFVMNFNDMYNLFQSIKDEMDQDVVK